MRRRRSRERVQRHNDTARGLDAPAQSHREHTAQAEPSLGRRATLPGDAQNRRRPVAVRHIQRVPAGHTGTQRDALPRASARHQRILERSARIDCNFSLG